MNLNSSISNLLRLVLPQKSGGHTGLAPRASFMGSAFEEFVCKGADRWLVLISDWLKLGSQVLLANWSGSL